MQMRTRIALALLLALAAGALAWQLLRESEPLYKRKPLFQWIAQGYFQADSGVTIERTDEAVNAIGTNAIPYYLSLIETKPDSPLKIWLLKTLSKRQWPWRFLYEHSANLHHDIGCAGLRILGPQAKAAVPRLRELLASQDDSRMTTLGVTLASMGLEGLSPLTNELASSDSKRRATVAHILRIYATSNGSVSESVVTEEQTRTDAILVPLLISRLDDDDLHVRFNALDSLALFRRQAHVIVPALAAQLHNGTNDHWLRLSALEVLNHWGPKADRATPVLLECLLDEDLEIRSRATNALKGVNPDAAAKAGVQ